MSGILIRIVCADCRFVFVKGEFTIAPKAMEGAWCSRCKRVVRQEVVKQ